MELGFWTRVTPSPEAKFSVFLFFYAARKFVSACGVFCITVTFATYRWITIRKKFSLPFTNSPFSRLVFLYIQMLWYISRLRKGPQQFRSCRWNWIVFKLKYNEIIFIKFTSFLDQIKRKRFAPADGEREERRKKKGTTMTV